MQEGLLQNIIYLPDKQDDDLFLHFDAFRRGREEENFTAELQPYIDQFGLEVNEWEKARVTQPLS